MKRKQQQTGKQCSKITSDKNIHVLTFPSIYWGRGVIPGEARISKMGKGREKCRHPRLKIHPRSHIYFSAVHN